LKNGCPELLEARSDSGKHPKRVWGGGGHISKREENLASREREKSYPDCGQKKGFEKNAWNLGVAWTRGAGN